MAGLMPYISDVLFSGSLAQFVGDLYSVKAPNAHILQALALLAMKSLSIPRNPEQRRGIIPPAISIMPLLCSQFSRGRTSFAASGDLGAGLDAPQFAPRILRKSLSWFAHACPS